MKNIKRAFLSVPALALGVSLLATPSARAADALAICQPGVPFAYPAGGTNIPWNPDLGALGPLTNAEGVAAVSAAFDAWENIPESSVTYLQGAPLSVDIDVTNFGPIYTPDAPNGQSEIVFDADGAIFELLFGPDSGILGFAGPDFGDPATCTLLEGSAFLNGPEFADSTVAEDIMVHEFGHYTNLGHVEVNGQLLAFGEGGDDTGPTPDNTTFPPPASLADLVETMYPFYFGALAGTRTPHPEDVASISVIYPAAGFASSTGTITGTIRAPNGTPLSGVNVIARNLSDPFEDAVSTFSGAYTNNTDAGSDPNVGVYTLANLTPGASYAVFIDTVTAAPTRFSNPILSTLPGPEEFYNGALESSDSAIDDPADYTAITAVAGSPITGIDIIFNQAGEGDPLPVGDDGSVQLFLPFPFCMQGTAYDAVFVNANGNLTFGAGSSDFFESAATMLNGPPRIAGLFRDLNPTAGGSVFFNQGNGSFSVTWQDVPEYFDEGANTFEIKLYDNSSDCIADDDGDSDSDSDSDRNGSPVDIKITYGHLDATSGLAGVSGGLPTASGAEVESDLTAISRNGRKKIQLKKDAAIYELFAGDNDLANSKLRFDKVGKGYRDNFEPNNRLETAAGQATPFNTLATNGRYSAIDPAAADIDFFRFGADAGQYLVAEVARGQIDSVLGLYYCPPRRGTTVFDSSARKQRLDFCETDTAILLAANDDFNGLLSRIEGSLPVTGTYAIAVTFCCDYDFDGVDPGQGLPLDQGRYILDVQLYDGLPLPLSDEASVILSDFGFSFPYGGESYSEIYVNDNGHITFGAGPDALDWLFISIDDFEQGPPRAAALWNDLDTGFGLVLATSDFATQLKLDYVNVPEWGGIGSNNFSITLHSDGTIEYDYGAVSATSGIVGAGEGNGEPSTLTDMSVTGGGSISDSPVEEFGGANPYDLANPDALTFTP